MGFFSDIGGAVTGGLAGTIGLGTGLAAGVLGGSDIHAANKAGSEQSKAIKSAEARAREAAEQARGDVNRLFPQAIGASRGGFQGALDVFGQSLPAQTSAFQQGNVGAQQQILAGLPQIQNALLGNQVDFGALQPFQLQQPDLSFFQQSLAPMPGEQAAANLSQIQQDRNNQIQQNITNLLTRGGMPESFAQSQPIHPTASPMLAALRGHFNGNF